MRLYTAPPYHRMVSFKTDRRWFRKQENERRRRLKQLKRGKLLW